MEHWYYAPWQYELRERLEPEVILSPRTGRGIPPAVKLTVLAGAAFLAYAPLLQPGPPARTPTPYVLPPITLGRPGGGMMI